MHIIIIIPVRFTLNILLLQINHLLTLSLITTKKSTEQMNILSIKEGRIQYTIAVIKNGETPYIFLLKLLMNEYDLISLTVFLGI